ncbi:MAG: hypothetical protein ACC726_03555 [Chloroflexota bacterium]
MRRSTNLVLGAAVAALAISTLGAPVAASSKAYVQIVNGIPGKRIDVCVNDKEIKSALPYGKVIKRQLHGGSKKIKFRKKSPGVCRGKRLASRTVPLPGGSDKTIVATNKQPTKVVVFDNAGLSTPAIHPPDSAWAVRYAANVDLGVKFDIDSATQIPLTPAVDPIWTKGDQIALPLSVGPGYPSLLLFTLWVTLPESTIPLAGPVVGSLSEGQRLQQVVVGNHPGNIRIVQFKQPIKFPFTP